MKDGLGILCVLIGLALMVAGVVLYFDTWPQYSYARSDLEKQILSAEKTAAIYLLVSGVIFGFLFIVLGVIANRVGALANHLLPPPVADWRCPECERMVQGGLKTCSHCGEAKPIVPPPVADWNCPECERKVQGGLEACPYCGEAKPIDEPGRDASPNAVADGGQDNGPEARQP